MFVLSWYQIHLFSMSVPVAPFGLSKSHEVIILTVYFILDSKYMSLQYLYICIYMNISCINVYTLILSTNIYICIFTLLTLYLLKYIHSFFFLNHFYIYEGLSWRCSSFKRILVSNLILSPIQLGMFVLTSNCRTQKVR